VAEAFERTGNHGIVAVEFGNTVETTLEIIEGMAFERGYLSHHMVTDVEKMQVVLDNTFVLMTDHKIQTGEQLAGVIFAHRKSGRPLLIIAEEVAPPVIIATAGAPGEDQFQGCGDPSRRNLAIGARRCSRISRLPPGGRSDFGRSSAASSKNAELHDLGSARQVRNFALEDVESPREVVIKRRSPPHRGAGPCANMHAASGKYRAG